MSKSVVMKKKLHKIILTAFLIILTALFNYSFACSGSTLAGNLTPTDNWQTISGVQAGDRYTFTLAAGEVIIFSFCQGGGSYTNDPMIDLHNADGSLTYQSNDDHCGYGSELVWVCPTSGTYSIGLYNFYCSTDGTALGTVAYKRLPTPTEQDCLGARPLCASVSNHPQSYVGTGHYYDLFNFNEHQGMAVSTHNCPNCLVTGEKNNVWYTFTAQTSGELAFTITPYNSSDDYDWAVYSLNNGVDCFDLIDWYNHPPVVCNYCGTSGNTGMGSGSSSCEGPNNCSNWNSALSVSPGETYVLNVSNFSSTQDGYTINFGASTATMVDNSPPELESLVYEPYCGSSSLTIQFTEAVWCSSVQPNDFVLTGPNGTYDINSTHSIVCAAASSNTYAGTWYDDVWTLELDDYLSHSGDYVLSILSGSVEDKCENVNNAVNLPFTIIGITADVNITHPISCIGGGCDGEIETTNIGGGTPPYTINWSGPDGFIANTANISGLCYGEYTITITDSEGICEYIETIIMAGTPPLNPQASSNSPICQGETLDLTVTTENPAISYQWSGPNGYSSYEQNPSRPASTPSMSGRYYVGVEDEYGCQAIDSVDVIVYPVQAVTVTSNTPYCTGQDIELNATIVNNATYQWVGPNSFTSTDTNPIITNCTLENAGSYSLTVTNEHSCQTSINHEIVVTPGIEVDVTATDPLCYNDANGWIDITVTNGTPNYTYLWSTGATGNIAHNLIGGNQYCVTVTDAAGCSLEVCRTLNNPAPIQTSVSNVATECGELDGELILNISGGVGGYTVEWTEGHTGEHITGLHPGAYTATITDANGCTKIINANVDFFGGSNASIIELQGISCNGYTTGILQANMENGASPFTYQWSVAGQTSQTLSNVGAGTYTVTVTDTYGCYGSVSYELQQPEKITISFDKTDVMCRGEKTGAATVNVAGGVFPYTYQWQHGPTSSHITSLKADTYVVQVTDMNGCQHTDFVVIEEPERSITIDLQVTNLTCYGKFDGSAIAEATGGTLPYNYFWRQLNSTIGSGPTIHSLHAGDYSVQVFDANNCKKEVYFSISEPSEIRLYAEANHITCKGAKNGSVGVQIVGGNLPYNILWNTNDTTNIVTDLGAGQYYVTVTDNNTCSKTLNILLKESSSLCLKIPDAFTPNGDGINDTWQIDYIEMYKEAFVYVFNRWGQKLYQARSGDEFWDGTFNGKPVPAGTYLYVIDLRNNLDPLTGTVTVVY
jgi:gliding motility-associated-like protein